MVHDRERGALLLSDLPSSLEKKIRIRFFRAARFNLQTKSSYCSRRETNAHRISRGYSNFSIPPCRFISGDSSKALSLSLLSFLFDPRHPLTRAFSLTKGSPPFSWISSAARNVPLQRPMRPLDSPRFFIRLWIQPRFGQRTSYKIKM